MAKLTELTQAQTDRMEFYRAKWFDNAVASADDKELYDAETEDLLKSTVIKLYKEANKNIDSEKIHVVDSFVMAVFFISAYAHGKKGVPKKKIKWIGKDDHVTGMGVVEDYLNTFSNPMEIVKNSKKYTESGLYWGIPQSGFCGYAEFFEKETDIDVDFSKMPLLRTVSKLTHLCIMYEKLCVVVKRPTTIRHDKGAAISDGKPYLIWADGIGIVKQ